MVTSNAGKNRFHYCLAKCRILNAGSESILMSHAPTIISNVGKVCGLDFLVSLTMKDAGIELMETEVLKREASSLSCMIGLLLIMTSCLFNE
jgi:hypothetical protein